MPRPKPAMPADIVEAYDRQIALHPEIERKGAANPYTSVNGHMFSCINKAGEVGIRLSKEDQEKFIEEHDSKLFESYGAIMRGYVTVPREMLDSDEEFQKYLTMSYEYVKSLKPAKGK